MYLYVPPKGRQGENHISPFSKLSKGKGMIHFVLINLVNYSQMDDKEKKKTTLINSKAV
jgi:hypothetical protein